LRIVNSFQEKKQIINHKRINEGDSICTRPV
jgi:hypothetical protein